MWPSYFDYIFVHQRQKARLRPGLSPKFLSTLGPNPTQKAWPDLQLCLGQEITKGSFGLRVKLPPAYLSNTQGGGFAQLLLIVKRQPRNL